MNRQILVATLLLAAPLAAQSELREDSLPTWSLVPELRIGDLDRPEYALERPILSAIGADGSVYVLEPTAGKVRVYDRNGRFLRDIGRRGEGPGELAAPMAAGLLGDTLWVSDQRNSRVSLFALNGRFIDSYALRLPGKNESGLPSVPGRILPGLIHVVQVDPPREALPAGSPRFTRHVVRLDRSGRMLDTLISYPATMGNYISFGRGGGMVFQPIQDAPFVVSNHSATSFLWVDRAAVERRGRGELRVRWLDLRGNELVSRTFTYTPRPLGPARRDSLTAVAMSIASRGGALRPEIERIIRQGLHLPEFLPPVTALVQGGDGSVWLRREDFQPAGAHWLVLDPQLQAIATVHPPPGATRLSNLHGDTVWGIEHDEFDVPYLIRYRIRR